MHAYFTSAVQSAQPLASQFDGDCAPSNSAPLVAAGVRGNSGPTPQGGKQTKTKTWSCIPKLDGGNFSFLMVGGSPSKERKCHGKDTAKKE
jgi:hypothetical protein